MKIWYKVVMQAHMKKSKTNIEFKEDRERLVADVVTGQRRVCSYE